MQLHSFRAWVSNDIEATVVASYAQQGYSATTAQTMAYALRRLAAEAEEDDADLAANPAEPLDAPPVTTAWLERLPRPPNSVDAELDLVCAVVFDVVTRRQPGAVLVFMPGMGEIKCGLMRQVCP